MSGVIRRELILLFSSIWQGAVLGLWYDLLVTARHLIRHGRTAVSLEDFFYWMGAALYLFSCFFRENSGILRAYLFGGVILGAVCYRVSFGKFLSGVLTAGIRKTVQLLVFPAKQLAKCVKKWRKRLKFRRKHGKM